MSINVPASLAVWSAPVWATRSDVDAGGVLHTAVVGEWSPLPEVVGQVTIDEVWLSQCDEVDTTSGIVSVTRRHPPEIEHAGHRLSAEQARHLAGLLQRAADLADAS